MPSPSVQSLRDALTDPAAYPHDPEHVEIEETHISLVALAPPWVYKVKKPVSLGFLDFTTLERRRHFCEEEVRLNTRLCPDTYVGVVPLVATDDGLRVDGEPAAGEVVEVAVKMRYLNPDQFLDARLDRGESPTADIDRLARTLCSFYRSRPSTPAVAAAGWMETLRVSTDENFAQTEPHIGTTLSRPVYEALRYYTDRFYDQHAALLHRRRAGGYIVDGHGDLRLEHVHVTDDRVAIYDCIEFNERFRHLDVANDVAFLCMDLDRSGYPALSDRLARRVADGLGDPDLTRLLPFYKCYRAYVRGKVDGMQAMEDAGSPERRARSRAQAHRYYQWALRYAVSGGDPLVVVVMGRSGTGKSTQAAALADALGWAHVSSDRVRKEQAGVPLHKRPDAPTREQLYTAERSDAVYATLRERAVERGAHSQGTVLDATYSGSDRRERLRTALRAAELPYAFVELTAPDDTLRSRLAARDHTSDTVSDARLDDFDTLMARYEAPDALEDPRHRRIDTDRSEDETTRAILKALIRLAR
jgi:aminoglycoside phosphotransferase family enzyme/predicted kinase